MNPTADRGNRTLLSLLALLLFTAAGLGLALSFSAFGIAHARQPLLLPAAQRFAHRNSGWFWPAVAVAAVILGLLALRWLLAQFGTDRVHSLDLEPNTTTGATTVHTSAVTDALNAEIENYRGVARAAARLIGSEHDPDLILAVTVHDRADLGALRDRIEEHAIAHARAALDSPTLPVRLRITLTAGGQRVR